MADISLKIKSDFAQAEADFKALIGTSEKLQKVNDVNSKEYKALSNQIDRYIEKNKLSTVAMTATQGKSAALAAEYKKLQTQIQSLISKGLDPMSPALDKLKNRMGEIQSYAPKATSSFSGMLSSLGALGIGFGTYQIANKIIDIGRASLTAAANMEQQTVALTTMLGSTEKATSLLADLQNFAASTPFQFEELVDASKRMIAFGFSAEEVTQKLGMIGDVSAGLSQPIGDMIYLFGQIKTQGRAMTQDLMQFANRGVPIYDELAKVLGVSTSEVKKFAEQGKIGFKEIDQVFKNMTSEGGKFAELMDAQSKTLAGQWSNFNDALEKTAIILGEKLSPMASSFVNGLTLAIKEFNSGSDPTIQKLDAIISKMSQAEQNQIFDMARWFKGDISGNLDKILLYQEQTYGKQGKINAAAALYQEFLMGRVNLTTQQAQLLQKIIGAEAQLGNKSKGKDGDPNIPKVPAAPKKSEEQIFQDRLNLMQNMELLHYANRQKMAEDFFAKKLELEKIHGEELMAWQAQQTALIAENDKLTFDQKIQAMDALSTAVAKKEQNDIKNFATFGKSMASNAVSMFTDLQTAMANAGKSSKALAMTIKILSAAEAGINSYLAFTQVLRDHTIYPTWLRIPMAGVILGAGLAKQAAILSTPISGQTGLTSYEVPDIRENRNDGAPIRAQAGETVSITPRGENPNSGITNISIKIGEAELFSIVQKGINTGEISITNNNIGRGVFAV